MRYFFDIRDDFYAAVDDEGLELPDFNAARREAVRVATAIARDVFAADGAEITVTIRSEEESLFDINITLRTKDLRGDDIQGRSRR
jgi:hypothetical protein